MAVILPKDATQDLAPALPEAISIPTSSFAVWKLFGFLDDGRSTTLHIELDVHQITSMMVAALLCTLNQMFTEQHE